jgi:predicted flap endonuclease-1-like 5' DNA nuclease
VKVSKLVFHGLYFNNTEKLLEAIADEWLTGGGGNSASFVHSTLASVTDEELAAEANNCWNLQATHDFEMRDLAMAFAKVRQHYSINYATVDDMTSVMIDGETETFFELRACLAVAHAEDDAEGTTGYLHELADIAKQALQNERPVDDENGPLAAITAAVNYFAEKARLNRPSAGMGWASGVYEVASVIGSGPWKYWVRETTAALSAAYIANDQHDIALLQAALFEDISNMRVADQTTRIARVVFPLWTVSDFEEDDLTAITGLMPALALKLRAHGITSKSQLAGLQHHEVEALDKALNCKGRLHIAHMRANEWKRYAV